MHAYQHVGARKLLSRQLGDRRGKHASLEGLLTRGFVVVKSQIHVAGSTECLAGM